MTTLLTWSVDEDTASLFWEDDIVDKMMIFIGLRVLCAGTFLAILIKANSSSKISTFGFKIWSVQSIHDSPQDDLS
jgi:hypothetical protein